MIRAEIELGGQLAVVFIEAENNSQAIEKIWNTYGYMTYIIGLEDVIDDTEEVVDDATNSNEPTVTD